MILLNCPRCNAPITKEGSNFCPHCGYNLTLNQEIKPEAQVIDTGANVPIAAVGSNNTRINKTVIIIIAAIAVIIAAFFGIRYFTNPTPDRVMTKFLNNLKAGKYEDAYKYLDDSKLNGNNYLTAEYFRKSFEDNPLTDYSYTVESSSDFENFTTDDEKTTFNVVLQLKKGPVTMNIPVYKRVTQGNKGKIMIDPGKFIKSTTIEQFSNGLTVSLDNKKIDASKYNKIPMFLNSKHKVKITSDMIKPIEKEITAGEDFGYDGPYEPTDEIVSKVKDIIDNFNKAWIKTVNSKNMSNIEPYVQWNSDEWNGIYNQISNNKNETVKDSDYIGVKFGNINFYNNQLDTLSVEADETWAGADYPNGKVNKWIYYLKLQDDGKLYIFYNSYR